MLSEDEKKELFVAGMNDLNARIAHFIHDLCLEMPEIAKIMFHLSDESCKELAKLKYDDFEQLAKCSVPIFQLVPDKKNEWEIIREVINKCKQSNNLSRLNLTVGMLNQTPRRAACHR